MGSNLTILESIKQQQMTIDKLLQDETLEIGRGGISNKWQLEPLFTDDNCTVGFVHISNVELGACQEHVHPESKEYLIVVKGSILLNINGVDTRVLKVGECAAVNANTKHFSRPLEDDTKLIYVCVPNDSFFSKYSEDFLKGKSNE